MGAGLSTTFERGAEPTTTSGRWARSARPAGAGSGLLLVLVAAAIATAGPAAAVGDPTRPLAEVTRGPSCHPGGIVVEVVAGTAGYTVRLSTTRQPGEDEVTLAPGAAATLQTGDVAPGETIDPRLEFTPLDGPGAPFVDELADWTLTRPTAEDCQAALSPPPPAPSAPTATVESSSQGSEPTAGPATEDRTPSGTSGTSAGSTPGPASGSSSATSGAAVPAAERPDPGASQVVAGGSVTLRGAGFLPGEQVDILLNGTGTVLATATADREGHLRVDVRIPDGATEGPVTLDLVGADSALVTGVPLQVAADARPVDGAGGVLSLVPLAAAAVALVGTTVGLVSVAGQGQALRRRRVPFRTA